MAQTSMKKMLLSGVHFGHRSRFWNPKMKPYIYGSRNDIHIINLEHTLPLFNDALNFVSKVVADGGSILFVGTKKAANSIIKEEAIRCGMPYVNNRWLGGMLTNHKTIKSSISRLKDLEFLAENNFAKFGKKEGLMMTREIKKLEKNLGGIKNLNGLPDVVFVVDIGAEKNAVNEAKKLNIPLIGVVDTNNNPEGIDYVIPGNDDSIRAIKFYAREISSTILETKVAVAASAAKNKEEVPKKIILTKSPTDIKKEKENETKPKDNVDAKEKPVISKESLAKMKKSELVDYAKKNNIKIKSNNTKSEIIETICNL
jgi:small subunit ribosomal protein S2